MRNLATTLPLKSKLSGKFQRFNSTDGSIEMLKKAEFPKVSIKMKNLRTYYKTQTASSLNTNKAGFLEGSFFW